jgi:hypothetical protein
MKRIDQIGAHWILIIWMGVLASVVGAIALDQILMTRGPIDGYFILTAGWPVVVEQYLLLQHTPIGIAVILVVLAGLGTAIWIWLVAWRAARATLRVWRQRGQSPS